MNEREFDDLKKLLKESLPPVTTAAPKHDLWPAMLRRLDARPVHVPWWDWALLAGATLLLCFFPGIIPALLYHL
jgi:hypothetical protein